MTFSVELFGDTRLGGDVYVARPPKSPHYHLAGGAKTQKQPKVAVGAVSFARFLRVFKHHMKNAQNMQIAPKARFCPLPMRVQKRHENVPFLHIFGAFWDPPM